MQARVGLAVLQRHPVVAVFGEQLEPGLEALLVEHARLGIAEIDELLVGDGAHAGSFCCMSAVMKWAQARYWLRICHSLVPLVTSFLRSASVGSYRRATFTQSRPRECRPCWPRS